MNRLNEIQLYLLKHFQMVCDTLGLEYFAIGGTAIGAIRHKGFIPWDDDLDVAMSREDFNIFSKEAQKLLPHDIFFQTHETDKNYLQPFAKLRHNESTFIEKGCERGEFHQGVYIDIFPYDYVPERNFTNVLYYAKSLLYQARIRAHYTESVEHMGKRAKIIFEIARPILKCLLPDVNATFNKSIGLCKSIPKSSRINLRGALWYWGRKGLPIDWFQETTLFPFENMYIKLPKGYHQYLSHVFGDYMTPPPEDARVAKHNIDILDTEHPYTYYIEN